MKNYQPVKGENEAGEDYSTSGAILASVAAALQMPTMPCFIAKCTSSALLCKASDSII